MGLPLHGCNAICTASRGRGWTPRGCTLAGPTTPSIPAKPGAAKSLSLPGKPSAVDACCSLTGTAQVVPGHDVMLTQTNIGE